MKTRILSGIQPSGVLHIGNYLGALKHWIALQNETNTECFYCIVDLHAITVPYDPQHLQQRVFDAAVDLLALGLNPKKSTLFVQSHVPEHTECMWLLNTITPIAELERMTQFKDRKQQHAQHISAGLLNYPVLMAADILLYKPQFIPVGEDQDQHVELTRVIARKFNATFADILPQPQSKKVGATGRRIASLSDPARKMSKSDSEKSYIALRDEPAAIEKKIQKAVTTPEGTANLRTLFELIAPDAYQEFAKESNVQMSAFKPALAQAITAHLQSYRERVAQLQKTPNEVWAVLEAGSGAAQSIAQQTLQEVKRAMGLLR